MQYLCQQYSIDNIFLYINNLENFNILDPLIQT